MTTGDDGPIEMVTRHDPKATGSEQALLAGREVAPSVPVGSQPSTEQRADHAERQRSCDPEAPEANDGVLHAFVDEPEPAIQRAE